MAPPSPALTVPRVVMVPDRPLTRSRSAVLSSRGPPEAPGPGCMTGDMTAEAASMRMRTRALREPTTRLRVVWDAVSGVVTLVISCRRDDQDVTVS